MLLARATPAWPKSAAIIGAGTMGLGVAECFAAAGIAVRLRDATPELTRRAYDALQRRTRAHVDAGIASPELLARVAATEATAEIADAVRDVDFIFEAVPERLDTKEETLRALSAVAAPEATIASNTSSLPIDTLAVFVHRPERFLGTHWFNPPEWTPGIEVIPHAGSSAECVARVTTFLAAIGKEPVVVKSGPGFVANRIQIALFLEAARCVAEGLASLEEVDAIVRSTFGFRLPFYGPFRIADMAGLDTYMRVIETLEERLGDRFFVPDTLREQVAAGRVGTKGGAGFFDYTQAERDRLLIERDRRYAALGALFTDQAASKTET